MRNMPQMMPVHRQLGPQIVGQALQQITEVSEPVKVFVGNISEKAGDTLVRQILMKCGSVANWRRTSGVTYFLRSPLRNLLRILYKICP